MGRIFDPQTHVLCQTSTISEVLQSIQQIPVFSPGKLKEGRLPHMHCLWLTLTIVFVLHAAQHMAFEMPNSLNDGLFPLPQEHVWVFLRRLFGES